MATLKGLTCDLYYEDTGGSLPPIVFLHGWCDGSESWTGTVAAFEGSYRCLAPDMRGHGQSGMPRDHAFFLEALSSDVAAAIKLIRPLGISVLNQTVQLKGVNDSSDEQIRLSERLFEIGVLPYYLHQLDKVQGAAHFQIPDQQARDIHQSMMRALPGYLVPKLVQEIPGEASKSPL